MKMNKNNTHNRRGITLIEAVIVGIIFVIVALAVSAVLAHNQRLWNERYNHTYSDVFTDGQIAKKIFDSVIRKSSEDNLLIDGAGQWVEVYYYADDTSVQLDRYARFFYQDDALFVEYGVVNPKETLNISNICDNVTHCVFRKSGRSVYMLLTINDGKQTQTIGTSAETHN